MPMLKILHDNPLLDGYIRKEAAGAGGYQIKSGSLVDGRWAGYSAYGIVYLEPEFVKAADEGEGEFPCSLFADPKEVHWQIAELQKNKTFRVRVDRGFFVMELTLDPITLANHELGQLKLSLMQNWAPCIDGLKVTGDGGNQCHPHVSYNGHLCYGDASSGGLAALKEGRFYDYFALVESVLKEYNLGDAYWVFNGDDMPEEDDEENPESEDESF